MTLKAPLIHGSSILLVALTGCLGVEESESDPTSDESYAATSDELTSWVECAKESGTPGTVASDSVCNFTGTKVVRYGTATQFTSRTLAGPVACNNATFGDPAFGTYKKCWYAQEVPDSSWTACAVEGGQCAFQGSREVRYGTSPESGYASLVRSNGTPCTNAVFGDPARGVQKRCWYGPLVNTQLPTRNQMYRLANPNITVEAGQDTVLKVRFYAATSLPDPSKVFTHLYKAGNDNTYYADIMHHYEWVPTGPNPGYGNAYNVFWNGYVEFDYAINVPETTPPGVYRIGSGMHQGVSPYAGRMNVIDCNGVARLSTNYGAAIQTCEVGTLTVTPKVHAPSTRHTAPQNMFAATGRTWSP